MRGERRDIAAACCFSLAQTDGAASRRGRHRLINLRSSFPFEFPFCRAQSDTQKVSREWISSRDEDGAFVIVTSKHVSSAVFRMDEKSREFCIKFISFRSSRLLWCEYSNEQSEEKVHLENWIRTCWLREEKMFCNHSRPTPTSDSITSHGEPFWLFSACALNFCARCEWPISGLLDSGRRKEMEKINSESLPFSLQQPAHVILRNCAINCKTLMHHN